MLDFLIGHSVPKTLCSVCVNVKLFPYQTSVCECEWIGLCYAINHPFVGLSYGCLPKQISWMRIPPTNIRTNGWHPSSFRLPIFVENRATHTYPLPQLCMCSFTSGIQHQLCVRRQQLLIDCTTHAYLCNDGVNAVNQIFLQITQIVFFIGTSIVMVLKQLGVCVPILGSSHQNAHTVLLSYCANCVQSWMILNLGWASR